MEDNQDSQSFQQYTQSTQQTSQQESDEVFDNVWGYLEPCSTDVSRISFSLDKNRYELGRLDTNDFILPGIRISGRHCVITWDGSYQNSSVTVLDESRNGTFINGVRIGQGNTAVLRHGSELLLCTSKTQNPVHGDIRFTYRHVAKSPMTTFETQYDLLRDLGRGSYGVVKEAVCHATGEHVAVKILKDAKTLRNPNSHPRSHYFRREVGVLRMLEHKNICELKDAFFGENESDNIYLILELVDGGDFSAYLRQNSPLSEVESQHFTYQICDALAYIHSKNITHRDLKPQNILLTKKRPHIVKVADFGLAKFVHSQTMLRTWCGSLGFQAPEIGGPENSEGYDNLVDSWSVGVIVFKMLTSRSPFIQDEQQGSGTQIPKIDWERLDCRDPSSAAIRFIRLLLKVDPRRRMALTNALDHPWFANYTPVYNSSDNILTRQ